MLPDVLNKCLTVHCSSSILILYTVYIKYCTIVAWQVLVAVDYLLLTLL